jgi:hypothetical protein
MNTATATRDLLDLNCDDQSVIHGSCEDCSWLRTGTGLPAIRKVMRDGDEHATRCRHSVKLDVEA